MKLIKASILLLALGAAAGCKKTEAPAADTGSITFAVAAQQEVADVTRSQISDITTLPAAADFTLTITDSKKQTVWSGSMGGMTEPYSLATGDYTVSAEYGSTTDEGFDKPCFTGSLAFTINGGDSKEITIPVSLANAIVKVSCTDMFNNYFTDYSFKITTASGAEIPFAKGESRGAFIDAFKFTIEGTLTNQGGTVQTFSKTYDSGINPATCYTVTFDAATVGGTAVTITFNDTTETVDLGDIELND